jgi:hypothetical protein
MRSWVPRRPFKRSRSGRYQLHLSRDERELLRSLPQQLNAVLGEHDASLRRLFPPAYTDDPEREVEYQGLMREELLGRRQAAHETMARTIDANDLDGEELNAWLATLNDFRLVLGTQLDVSEDDVGDVGEMGDKAPEYALYRYLTYLEEAVVEALAGQ